MPRPTLLFHLHLLGALLCGKTTLFKFYDNYSNFLRCSKFFCGTCNSIIEPPHDKTNKITCAPSKDSNQPGHPPVRSESMLPAWRNLWSLAIHWAHSKDWSDWADAQADMSLCWVHWSFCWFCHAAAHMKNTHTSLSIWSSFCFRTGCNDGNRLQCTSTTFKLRATADIKPTLPCRIQTPYNIKRNSHGFNRESRI